MSIGGFPEVLRKLTLTCALSLLAQLSPAQQAALLASADDGLNPIQTYIHTAWDTLSRSMSACDTVGDPKLVEPSVLYLPAGYPRPDALRDSSNAAISRYTNFPPPSRAPARYRPRLRRRACFTCPIAMSCQEGGSTRCTDGTATSFSADWSRTSASTSPAA